jgi:ribosomal protein L30/L7E
MRRTLEAMGLRGHQAVIERPMSAALRGQIKHVRHLLEVTPAGAAAPSKKPAAKKATKAKATNG